ncbi:hypothetical protein ACFE04_027192 [Oxalis oulophora]
MTWKVLKKGHINVPHVAYMCTRAKNVLDFEKLGQKVDADKYYKIGDLLTDFNSLFENARKEYAYSNEMIPEVDKVCNIFSEIMKTQFPNVEIPKSGLPPKSSGPIFSHVMEEIGTSGPTSSSAGVRF